MEFEDAFAKKPGWLRALRVAAGMISIVLAAAVLIFPNLALITLIYMLSFGLIINGLSLIAAGLSGKYPMEHLEIEEV